MDCILGSAHRVFTAVFGAVSGAVFGTPFGKRNWKKKATPNSHNCSARACAMKVMFGGVMVVGWFTQ